MGYGTACCTARGVSKPEHRRDVTYAGDCDNMGVRVPVSVWAASTGEVQHSVEEDSHQVAEAEEACRLQLIKIQSRLSGKQVDTYGVTASPAAHT